jgi:UDP-glucose 4-epimerase
VLDDLSTGRRENLEHAEAAGASLTVGDLADQGTVRDVVERARPEAVFHLGAQIDVRRSVADPGFDAGVNVLGTINVLEAIREAGTGASFVFISTGGAIYGEGEGRRLPLGEDEECLPEAPYGQSKLAAEGYVSLYGRLYGLPGVSLRLANVYGPRQDPLGEAGVVAIFCGRLQRGEPPLVFGDGLQTRDYLDVGDAVAAMLAAEERLRDGARDYLGTFNIGTGRETNVLELVEALGRIARVDVEPRKEPPRPGEVQRISLDASAARRELGWSPGVELESGLERTFVALASATVR